MASSDVSNVTKFFSTAAEGFSTTLGSTISAEATSVGLNSTSGLTNGNVFVGIIEPGATAQQVFTGTVDVGGSQITNVVWVRGTNVGHAGGVTIVDYVTGAAHNMMTAGILKQHTQAGAHVGITNTGGLTTDTLNATGLATLSGGTTLAAGDIGTADIANANVTPDKLATGAATAIVLANQSTASASYTDLGTVGPAVTVTIGANGLALVCVTSDVFNGTSGTAALAAVAVSGASTVAANDTDALSFTNNASTNSYTVHGSTVFLVTGLTPGSNTFTMKYRQGGGGTAVFQNRKIAVIPL